MASTAALNASSPSNAPWTVLIHHNNINDSRTIIAPAWVDSANIRSTVDILQSCSLTLFACIYTALHLDVPTKTAWHRLLLTKLEWVAITLFAPEVSIYLAADQLHQAWKLRNDLLKNMRSGSRNLDFDIDLRYCFFIVMGGVHVDVDDMISVGDLDHEAFDLAFKPRPSSVRLNPKAVVWLAKRGHWISIPKSKIDDKSKADVLQKILVVIQVSWMVVQCITRWAYDLPLSLLEIHTMVHVFCAWILYMCWIKKPLNVQEPEVVIPKSFKGEIALLLQQQFYYSRPIRLGLFHPKDSPNQPPPPGADHRISICLLEQYPGSRLRPSDAHPFDLEYHYVSSTVDVTEEFRRRWNAILGTFPFENSAQLAQTLNRFNRGTQLFLNGLGGFLIGDRSFYRNMPFGEGKRNIDINMREVHLQKASKFGSLAGPIVFCMEFRWLMALAVVLSAAYGGVHLSALNSVFPSGVEKLLWKTSCICVAGFLPASVAVGFLVLNAIDQLPRSISKWFALPAISWAWLILIAYIAFRVFIIVEAFISLRHVPAGVYVSPSWIQMIPHL